MRAYADSSFILKMFGNEADSEEVIAIFRRVGKPPLYFLPLHRLEVTSSILQRAFHQRRSVSSDGRKLIAHERDLAMSRLDNWVHRGSLAETTIDSDAAHQVAMKLIHKHSERVGARAIDILHVANALTLRTELFFTTDERQARMATAEGLQVNA